MVGIRLNKTRYYYEIETFETDNRINYKSGNPIVEGKTDRAWYITAAKYLLGNITNETYFQFGAT